MQSAGVGAAAAAAIATAGARAWVGVAASNGSIQSNGGSDNAAEGRHGLTKKVGWQEIRPHRLGSPTTPHALKGEPLAHRRRLRKLTNNLRLAPYRFFSSLVFETVITLQRSIILAHVRNNPTAPDAETRSDHAWRVGQVGFKLICHAPLMPDNGLLDDDPSDSLDDVLEVRNGGGFQRTRRPTLHDFVEVECKGATESAASLTGGHSSERLSELIGSMHCTYRSLTVAMGSDASIPVAGSPGDHVGRKPPRVPGRRDSIGDAPEGLGLVGADVEQLSCSPGSDFGGLAEPPMMSTADANRTSPTAESSGNAIELRWTEPPTTVLVVCKPHGGPALETALETALEILVRQERIQVWVEPSVKQELPRLTNTLYTWDAMPFAADDAINKPPEWLVSKLDLVVTLGGDGTVLWVSNLLGHGPMPPVAAVALGSLGFMTPLPADNLVCCLRGVLRGGFMLTLRHRLHCRIVRNGEHRGRSFDSLPLAPGAARAEEWVVMNECTVDRGVSPFLTSLKAYCNDTFITDVQGDGLIVSTPSGSTAYSLAAGGSMVHPQVPCFLFTPICPHSLSFRPLVFPDSVKLRLTVPGDSRATMWASFDGKGRTQLNAGDSVVIRLSPWPMPTICLKDDTGDWFRSVRHNLHFNLRQQQGGATS